MALSEEPQPADERAVPEPDDAAAPTSADGVPAAPGDTPVADHARVGAGVSRRVLLGAGAAVLVLVAVVLTLVLRDGADPRSAAEGPDGTRTFEGLPTDLPASVLPEGARDVEGTVLRSGTAWTAAASFTADGDHEALARAGDEPLTADGFVLRQRAFDERTMQVIYDHPDGSVLTMVYRRGEVDGVTRIDAIRTIP